jgi:hypothetical protein
MHFDHPGYSDDLSLDVGVLRQAQLVKYSSPF